MFTFHNWTKAETVNEEEYIALPWFKLLSNG